MSVMIQIRHVPDEIHKALKIRAVQKGMNLSEYLLREITAIAQHPTLEEVVQRIESRPAVRIEESSVAAVRSERESR